MMIDLPRLGQLAAPALQKLPRNWGGVRGPLGAAGLSLGRIGWSFATPFAIQSPTGERFALTSTSPALIAYHLQLAWKCAVGQQAGKAIGMQDAQIDATCYRKVMSSEATSGKDKALLRAFVAHAVWSPQRLHDVGYDIATECRLCGEASDSLGHRLFQCRCTTELRWEYGISPEDVDFIRYHSDIRALGLGLQIMPPPITERQSGLGSEQWESWTLTGGPSRTFWSGTCLGTGRASSTAPPPGLRRAGRWLRSRGREPC